MPNRPRTSETLSRGLRGRCPRCGQGPLFKGWITSHERCSACQLKYQRNNGDIWMFMIITDRIPVLIGIALVYFGFRAESWIATVAVFAALAIPLVASLRHRQGLALALDYLWRIYLPDPSDEIHSTPWLPPSPAA